MIYPVDSVIQPLNNWGLDSVFDLLTLIHWIIVIYLVDGVIQPKMTQGSDRSVNIDEVLRDLMNDLVKKKKQQGCEWIDSSNLLSKSFSFFSLLPLSFFSFPLFLFSLEPSFL